MARCETYLVLTSEEVNANIPYALVCMTRFGACWETGRRRAWLEEFTGRNGQQPPGCSISPTAGC